MRLPTTWLIAKTIQAHEGSEVYPTWSKAISKLWGYSPKAWRIPAQFQNTQVSIEVGKPIVDYWVTSFETHPN